MSILSHEVNRRARGERSHAAWPTRIWRSVWIVYPWLIHVHGGGDVASQLLGRAVAGDDQLRRQQPIAFAL